MTYELWTLVIMGFYLMALGYIPGLIKIKENDVIATKNFNRDNFKPLTGKGARAQRAIDNLYENLPAFTIVVLLVHITDAYNDMTQLGATLFLAGRLLHPLLYIAGRPFLRSTSYAVGFLGVILLTMQLA